MDTRHNEPSFYLVILYGWLSILPNCVFKGMESKPQKLRLMILRNFKNHLCHYYAIFSVKLLSLVTFFFKSVLMPT
jgi:hypothetical protein